DRRHNQFPMARAPPESRDQRQNHERNDRQHIASQHRAAYYRHKTEVSQDHGEKCCLHPKRNAWTSDSVVSSWRTKLGQPSRQREQIKAEISEELPEPHPQSQQEAGLCVVVGVPGGEGHDRKQQMRPERASVLRRKKFLPMSFFRPTAAELCPAWTGEGARPHTSSLPTLLNQISEQFPDKQRQGSQDRSLFRERREREPEQLLPRAVFDIRGQRPERKSCGGQVNLRHGTLREVHR